jgi:hypothetical protein
MTGISAPLPASRSAYPVAGGWHRAEGSPASCNALHLEPAETAIQALCDRRRWLRRSTVPLHPNRPCLSLGAVGLADGLLGGFAGVRSADLRAPDGAAVDRLARFGAHGGVNGYDLI